MFVDAEREKGQHIVDDGQDEKASAGVMQYERCKRYEVMKVVTSSRRFKSCQASKHSSCTLHILYSK